MTDSVVKEELEKVISPETLEVLINVFVPVIEDAIASLETWHSDDKRLSKTTRCGCTDCRETRPWLQELLHKLVIWHLYLNDTDAGVTLEEVVGSLLPIHGTVPINTRWPLLIRNEKLKRKKRQGQMTLGLVNCDSSLDPSQNDGLEVVSECLN